MESESKGDHKDVFGTGAVEVFIQNPMGALYRRWDYGGRDFIFW